MMKILTTEVVTANNHSDAATIAVANLLHETPAAFIAEETSNNAYMVRENKCSGYHCDDRKFTVFVSWNLDFLKYVAYVTA